jgi:hypothetical protein
MVVDRSSVWADTGPAVGVTRRSGASHVLTRSDSEVKAPPARITERSHSGHLVVTRNSSERQTGLAYGGTVMAVARKWGLRLVLLAAVAGLISRFIPSPDQPGDGSLAGIGGDTWPPVPTNPDRAA